MSNTHTPEAVGRMHYIDGYDPVSYEAPHSSLLRFETWVGMGLVLSALCPAGITIFAVALMIFGNTGQADITPTILLWIGVILTVAFVAAGSLLIRYGRRYYKQYVKETGRKN
ncbi:hypothetical protein H7347_08955 [Corynebacterium sp. zg-331]|uniref:hypothetical protein n=1 Tax=unclassified Corynebacterium TaxID=2624378 RepID=UPI00128DAADB|nr:MULTISPECIES: hypothetical protein [unclassified Corynebacterium]MBC3186689.1 hypothetical protein [Corynebacterium sp. zg-331]MPV53171.1 hypothetical protein [Corynebacterium sp. zg331]